MKGNTKRRRYRGRVVIALHGDWRDPEGVTVCADPLAACLHLAGWPDGIIVMRPACEWPEAARFLAGEAVRCPIPAHRVPEPIIASVARDAYVSRQTARRALVAQIEEAGGVGARFLPVAEQWVRDRVSRGVVLLR